MFGEDTKKLTKPSDLIQDVQTKNEDVEKNRGHHHHQIQDFQCQSSNSNHLIINSISGGNYHGL
ncbi:hypothetical protein DERP_004087 [Dermatophagoides pteronyssinus]|uniref:Uncharacterized protein n=1 Tax=Dermatophagoides pteronyssinus TaxID=6956 RepID=A0ABQ8J850_DERPT|nr:hypothetical protein DERP_004087 [Dermatophagoides pteronyssinus]